MTPVPAFGRVEVYVLSLLERILALRGIKLTTLVPGERRGPFAVYHHGAEIGTVVAISADPYGSGRLKWIIVSPGWLKYERTKQMFPGKESAAAFIVRQVRAAAKS